MFSPGAAGYYKSLLLTRPEPATALWGITTRRGRVLPGTPPESIAQILRTGPACGRSGDATNHLTVDISLPSQRLMNKSQAAELCRGAAPSHDGTEIGTEIEIAMTNGHNK